MNRSAALPLAPACPCTRLSLRARLVRFNGLRFLAVASSIGLHVALAGVAAYAAPKLVAHVKPDEPVAIVLVAAPQGEPAPAASATEERAPAAPVAQAPVARGPVAPKPVAKRPIPRPAPSVVAEPVIPAPVIPETVETPVRETSAVDASAVETVDSAQGPSGPADATHASGAAFTAQGGTGAGDGVRNGSPFGMADGDAIDVKQAAKAPRVLEHKPPEYPSRARRSNIEGRVVVRAIVGRDGRVEPQSVSVLRSVPALDEAAMDAVRAWRFSPALDGNDRPIRVIVKIPVRFALG